MDERSSYLTHLKFEQAGDLPFAEKTIGYNKFGKAKISSG
jgi:hypothetical protein